MNPILHLSLPVRDLAESRHFYGEVLGCELGRVRDRWFDVWFYGMQLTLHEQPDQVLAAEDAGVRHFGVTLTEEQFDALVRRLGDYQVRWLRGIATDYAGSPAEQTKATISDPSGNAIEVKWYVQPSAAFELPADRSAGAPNR